MAKILIVDDDPGIVALLEKHLTGRGYAVASVTDAMKVASVCVSAAPDLILLDYVLPGASGRLLLDRIRSLPGLAAVPVVVITAHSLAEVISVLPDRGLRFIEKPFDMLQLDRLLTELLGFRAVPAPPPPGPALPSLPPIPMLAPRPTLQLGEDEAPGGGGETLDLDA
jgi:two-component system phosphate regulon response regulator PhoB